MKPSADLAALVDTFAARRSLTSQLAQLAAATPLAGFTDWYSPTAVSQYASTVTAAVESAQRQVAASTNAYLIRATRQITGRTIAAPTPVDPSGLRTGVDHRDVYARVAERYRWLRSTGKNDAEARDQATNRAATLAATDIDLAFREQAARFTAEHRLQHRRVIRPELSGDGGCGLCVAASDVTLAPHTPMPIHPHCACVLLPLTDRHDPAAALNRADDRELERTPYAVRHHGELGPMLTAQGDHWRGPAQVVAAA